jgi:hypothetical protein
MQPKSQISTGYSAMEDQLTKGLFILAFLWAFLRFVGRIQLRRIWVLWGLREKEDERVYGV